VNREEGKGATGQEVLVVDADRKVLSLLEKLLVEGGMTVTAMADPARAKDQVEKRFIPVVLSDLDVPHAGGGIELVQFARDKSPLTSVILMTTKKTFEVVAPAFRSGARDVVSKTLDALPYICDRVVEAARELRVVQGREQLIADLTDTHDEFLRKMMDLQRQVTDLEDKLLAREGAAPSAVMELSVMNVLLVDEGESLNSVIVRDLTADKGWRIRHAQSGGEALDAASQNPPQILVVRETLRDLSANMVIKSIKGRNPDALALMFNLPQAGRTGAVHMVDASKLLSLIPDFSAPEQMVTQLKEAREALVKKAKERRFLNLFRKQHFDFLKKHQGLRQRLASRPPATR
jgi:two-component system, OmpR family, response regulator